MNLEEIKSAWDNESTENIKVPDSIELLGKARHPIEKIRTNMKHEFKWQIISIILLAFVPLTRFNFTFYMFYYVLYVLVILISAYYFHRFYLLFKYIHNYNADTKDNLYEMYYAIKLNMETYWSFAFAIMPFIFGMVGLLWFDRILARGVSLTVIINKYVPIFGGLAILLILFFMIATKWWINNYGKYTKKIKQVLDELREH